MISKPDFATVLTFCGLYKPCVDIAVHKQDQSSKNDIKFWPKSVSTCWVNHSRGSIVTTGTANWDTLDEDAMGEKKGGHVVMIRDDAIEYCYMWSTLLRISHTSSHWIFGAIMAKIDSHTFF